MLRLVLLGLENENERDYDEKDAKVCFHESCLKFVTYFPKIMRRKTKVSMKAEIRIYLMTNNRNGRKEEDKKGEGK